MNKVCPFLYYKVVREDQLSSDVLCKWKTFSSDLLMSASDCSPRLQLLYEIGQWKRPNLEHSKLFVFSSLKEAKSFAGLSREIYTCEVKNPSKIRYIPWFNSGYTHIKGFWDARYNKKKSIDFCCENGKLNKPQRHTVIVDAIKLIRRIQ